jgi:DNA primase
MNLFQFICSALPILDVISDHVALKPAGHYWKGPCPFHSETDASFTVSPDRQMFYCFGCHASGDVIAFMAKLENAGQYEAAQMLIERYKLKIPEDLLRRGEGGGSNPAVQEVKARAELALKTVAQWCHDSLMKNRGGYEYLTNRGLQDATIKQFQIGLFPGGVQGINTLMKEMGRLGILTKDLIEAGVLSLGEKSGHYYSPFEERIIFPIKDHSASLLL